MNVLSCGIAVFLRSQENGEFRGYSYRSSFPSLMVDPCTLTAPTPFIVQSVRGDLRVAAFYMALIIRSTASKTYVMCQGMEVSQSIPFVQPIGLQAINELARIQDLCTSRSFCKF
jgi:hypothetical protein